LGFCGTAIRFSFFFDQLAALFTVFGAILPPPLSNTEIGRKGCQPLFSGPTRLPHVLFLNNLNLKEAVKI